MYKDAEGIFHCTECEFSTKYLQTCKRHIESKHMSTTGYYCQYCDTVCPTRNALTMHIGRKHKHDKY